jgi:hypothetical protein
VNDSLIYNTDIPGRKLGMDYILMSKVNKIDSIMKFRIQINENDTSFYYRVTDVDSLLVGLYYDETNVDLQRKLDLFNHKISIDSLRIGKHHSFFVFDESDVYVWQSD